MNTIKHLHPDISVRAKKIEHYTNLLLLQCNSWLSEEEGMKNIEKKLKRKKRLKTTSKACLT